MAGILPLSGTQQFDNATGAFLNGGKLYVYSPGTTTPAAIFSTVTLTPGSELPSPIYLDSAGRIPKVYAANGSVRVYLKNSSDVLQYDLDNLPLVTAASGTGTTPVIPDSTQLFTSSDLKIRFDDQALEGYVRLNGKTLGSATSGATEYAGPGAETLYKKLWGFANVTLPLGKGASAAADWSANKQLTLPDAAGRLMGFLDDLGNGAQGRITATTVTGPTAVGATGGAQTVTVAQGNLPNVNFTVSGITLSDPPHSHSDLTAASVSQATVAGGTQFFSTNGASTTGTSTSGVTVATQGVAASGGSGTAVNKMPPVMLFTVYLKL